jgi:hypothetical protein
MNYTHFKDLIAQYTGLEKDALHIHAALFIYILVAILFRRSPRSFLPWTMVLFVELANEAHDVWENWGAPAGWVIGESVKDLWNTMLWPTVLLLAAHLTRWVPWGGTEDEATAPDATDGAAPSSGPAAGG